MYTITVRRHQTTNKERVRVGLPEVMEATSVDEAESGRRNPLVHVG